MDYEEKRKRDNTCLLQVFIGPLEDLLYLKDFFAKAPETWRQLASPDSVEETCHLRILRSKGQLEILSFVLCCFIMFHNRVFALCHHMCPFFHCFRIFHYVVLIVGIISCLLMSFSIMNQLLTGHYVVNISGLRVSWVIFVFF